MSRQTMISPISVLLAGVIVILLLLAGTSASTQAITRRQGSTPRYRSSPGPIIPCFGRLLRLRMLDHLRAGSPHPGIVRVPGGCATVSTLSWLPA